MKTVYPLVGMKHRGSEALVASMKAGEPLALIREPDNRYDPNAVQVWAREQHVGYIKASVARPIALAMDAAKVCEKTAKLAFSGDRWPLVEIEL